MGLAGGMQKWRISAKEYLVKVDRSGFVRSVVKTVRVDRCKFFRYNMCICSFSNARKDRAHEYMMADSRVTQGLLHSRHHQPKGLQMHTYPPPVRPL
jgi:hypothetical protein